MKKIAILLALALALSCCLLMLASCGEEETSSPATSSEAASSTATSSAATSSAASSSDAASSTDDTPSQPAESSEPDESSEDPAASKDPNATTNPDHENLALGKTYTMSQLFQQGETVADDGTKTWGWSEDAAVSYPDEGGVTLTDGEFAASDSTYNGTEWFGFHSGCPDYTTNGYSYFTVDLGEVYELSNLAVYVGTSKLTGGISVPATIEFLVSEDGENFTSVGTVTPKDNPDNSVLAVEQECDVTARYVQVRLTAANWMFVCEFEAY